MNIRYFSFFALNFITLCASEDQSLGIGQNTEILNAFNESVKLRERDDSYFRFCDALLAYPEDCDLKQHRKIKQLAGLALKCGLESVYFQENNPVSPLGLLLLDALITKDFSFLDELTQLKQTLLEKIIPVEYVLPDKRHIFTTMPLRAILEESDRKFRLFSLFGSFDVQGEIPKDTRTFFMIDLKLSQGEFPLLR